MPIQFPTQLSVFFSREFLTGVLVIGQDPDSNIIIVQVLALEFFVHSGSLCHHWRDLVFHARYHDGENWRS